MSDREVLPCGCVAENIGETFVYTPCDLECSYYLYVQEASSRLGLPVETVVVP